jgi:hypothetical protein
MENIGSLSGGNSMKTVFTVIFTSLTKHFRSVALAALAVCAAQTTALYTAATEKKQAAQQIAQAADILTPGMRHFIQSNQVPAALKKELDACFADPEIHKALQAMGQAIEVFDDPAFDEEDPDDKGIAAEEAFKAAKKILAQKGIKFFPVTSKANTKVFSFTRFPLYVFKLGSAADEKFLVGRVKYAQEIQSFINNNKLTIKVPNKAFYRMPAGALGYYSTLLVVAQKFDLSSQVPIRGQLLKEVESVITAMHFSDADLDECAAGDGSNILGRGAPYNDVVIIDTEPYKVNLDYPEPQLDRFALLRARYKERARSVMVLPIDQEKTMDNLKKMVGQDMLSMDIET